MNDIREIKQLIETKAYHPYLQKYMEKPMVDEDKLLLLWGLFNELDISSRRTEPLYTFNDVSSNCT